MLYNADALIADVAACRVMRHVSISKISKHPWQLHQPGSCITPAGMRPLLAAPWLQEAVTLELACEGRELGYSSPYRLSLAEAMPLLTAPMMQSLRVPVRPVADSKLWELAQQLRRPVEVLVAQMMLGGQ